MKEAGRAIEKYQPLWGSWKVEEFIGEVSGAEVYRVYKEEWGRRYISTVKLLNFFIGKSDIKEAQTIGINSAAMPEYFKSLVGNIQNEIELMYKLRGNSNIVTYEDHAIYEKKADLGWDVLIRMEFLQPLPDYQKGQELSRSEVAKLGIEICKALEACVREGIIHRDIRESSIFVSPKGEYKLGSFSMAKELSKGGRIALASFNPLYMAPELYLEQSYDFSVDIYSLGIVMYKLLNRGRLPFLPLPPVNITFDDTERSVASRMAGEEWVLPVDAGENLGAIILKACSYDKKDRYKSPYEFGQKLERFLKSETKAAKGDSMSSSSTADCAVVEVNYEAAQILAEKGEVDARAAYAKGLERIAVVELAASVDKIDNERKLIKKKLIRNAGIWTAVVVLAFAIAFINAYEVEPATEEPVAKAAIEIAQISPSPTIASTLTPAPAVEKSGEEYYMEGLSHMKNNRNELALSDFEKAKKLGYDSGKANSQIRTIRKRIEIQKLNKKAVGYYEQHDYEKAIAAYAELVKVDADYSSSAQYEDSFFRLAEEHNSVGMKYFNEGKPEQSAKEFDAALGVLEMMKKDLREYDQERYKKWNSIYTGNKSSMLEKIQKIDEYIKLANECNAAGVKYYDEGNYKKAKVEFENAIKQLEEIKLLVPKYSANGYAGFIQIYEGNLKRTEAKM